MNNYTASFLNFFGKEILDSQGNSIQTITYCEIIPSYKYHRASIVYSIFNEQKKMKEPIVRETRDLGEVEKLGFVLISIPISKDKAWNRFQRSIYKLIKKGSIGFSAMNQLKVMPRKVNDAHRVQIDEANLLIRLVGPKAGPNGESPWLSMGDEE